ncbi:MAG: energy transducer TonB [Terriglobales bacterium]|jgi:TonB family protein
MKRLLVLCAALAISSSLYACDKSPAKSLSSPTQVTSSNSKAPVHGVIGGIGCLPPPRQRGAAVERLRLSPAVESEKLIAWVIPEYPGLAGGSPKQGRIVVKALITKDGSVQQLTPIRGDAELLDPAMKAIRLWKYSPYPFNGIPMEVETTIAMSFQVDCWSGRVSIQRRTLDAESRTFPRPCARRHKVVSAGQTGTPLMDLGPGMPDTVPYTGAVVRIFGLQDEDGNLSSIRVVDSPDPALAKLALNKVRILAARHRRSPIQVAMGTHKPVVESTYIIEFRK